MYMVLFLFGQNFVNRIVGRINHLPVRGNVELFLVPSGCLLYSACFPFIIDESFLFNLLEIQIVGRSLFSSLNINALRLGSQSMSPEITCSSILSQVCVFIVASFNLQRSGNIVLLS